MVYACINTKLYEELTNKKPSVSQCISFYGKRLPAVCHFAIVASSDGTLLFSVASGLITLTVRHLFNGFFVWKHWSLTTSTVLFSVICCSAQALVLQLKDLLLPKAHVQADQQRNNLPAQLLLQRSSGTNTGTFQSSARLNPDLWGSYQGVKRYFSLQASHSYVIPPARVWILVKWSDFQSYILSTVLQQSNFLCTETQTSCCKLSGLTGDGRFSQLSVCMKHFVYFNSIRKQSWNSFRQWLLPICCTLCRTVFNLLFIAFYLDSGAKSDLFVTIARKRHQLFSPPI